MVNRYARLAMRLIDEANVGLAPGTAFGAGGERFMRLCFARNVEQLETAVGRIAAELWRAADEVIRVTI